MLAVLAWTEPRSHKNPLYAFTLMHLSANLLNFKVMSQNYLSVTKTRVGQQSLFLQRLVHQLDQQDDRRRKAMTSLSTQILSL